MPASTKLAAESIDSAATMSSRRPTDNVPDPANGEIPVEDCLAVKPIGRVQIDNLRKQLTVIRGEILEIAEQGAQHGLGDVKREIAKLARTIQQLEVLLGLRAPE